MNQEQKNELIEAGVLERIKLLDGDGAAKSKYHICAETPFPNAVNHIGECSRCCHIIYFADAEIRLPKICITCAIPHLKNPKTEIVIGKESIARAAAKIFNYRTKN